MGAKIALHGLVKVAILALAKLFIGIFTGMIVLIADALSSFADLLALFAAFLGLKISTKSADKGFSYGYYKVETFASLFVSLIIVYLGAEIFIKSLERFSESEAAQYQILGVIMVIVTFYESYHLAHKLKHTGKEINSLALLNCGKDKIVDMYIQVIVLAGIGANYFHIPYLEGAIGMGISLYTLKEGVLAAKESLYFLLDYYDDDKLIKKIRKTILQNSTVVKGVQDIKLRRAGTVIFGEALLELNPYSETGEIRNELTKLKVMVIDLEEYLKDFSLMITIPKPAKVRLAFPVVKADGMESVLAKTMEQTSAYVFVDIDGKRMKKYSSEKFRFRKDDFSSMKDFLLKHKVHIVINNDMHSLLYYNVRHLNHIPVYPNFGNIDTVKNAVKLLKIDL
jgi:cation diffusion facilitator family transporter